MAESVAFFFDKTMNITERVPAQEKFFCSQCSWVGLATDLATHKQFSCCPECKNYDVRVQNDFKFRPTFQP